ncbi:hypothetical protein RRG08_052381 [Elysia crispata]|uniref:Uncharacterized protein n=1 Tax=Elysia crispata TaxID=231223 RepID=A0AAE1DTH8_9GAST|nr:hypothetical protein RRG08_052381 [Elysia crispata]
MNQPHLSRPGPGLNTLRDVTAEGTRKWRGPIIIVIMIVIRLLKHSARLWAVPSDAASLFYSTLRRAINFKVETTLEQISGYLAISLVLKPRHQMSHPGPLVILCSALIVRKARHE